MTTTSETGPGFTPVPGPAKSEAPATDNRPGPLLALVLAAQFMAVLDVFIVNVAAPTIGAELHASGVTVLLGDGGFVPHPPRTGNTVLDTYPWAAALEAASP